MMNQQQEELQAEARELLDKARELLDDVEQHREESHARTIYAALIARHGPDNMEQSADVARRAARVYAGGSD